MTTVLLRSEKGSALTNDELDANFSNLNSDKQELSDVLTSIASLTEGGVLELSDNLTASITEKSDSILSNSSSTIATSNAVYKLKTNFDAEVSDLESEIATKLDSNNGTATGTLTLNDGLVVPFYGKAADGNTYGSTLDLDTFYYGGTFFGGTNSNITADSLVSGGDFGGWISGYNYDCTQFITRAGTVYVRGSDSNPITKASDFNDWTRLLDTDDISTSTSSSSDTLIASASAVKSAYDLANTANTTANAALPKSGGTITGNFNITRDMTFGENPFITLIGNFNNNPSTGEYIQGPNINTHWRNQTFLLRGGENVGNYTECGLFIYVDGNWTPFYFRNDGNAYAQGTWNNGSDIRRKSNIVNIYSALNNIRNIHPITYIMDGRKGIGYSAQELQKYYPQCVWESSPLLNIDEDGTKHYVKDKNGNDITDNVLSVNYGGMSAVNTQAIKELDTIVTEQKSIIESQNTEIQDLKATLSNLIERLETLENK